jgi:GT2 family glycosyltransferase
MAPNSPQFNKQNELIRSLRNQLEATERELAGQKWVLQQFLQSPSWRLTYPIRWLARQLRALRAWFSGGAADDRVGASTDTAPLQQETEEPEEIDTSSDPKVFLTNLYKIQLQSFLTSKATLRLPHSHQPEISVILVLFNRAELTLLCLRSLAENYSQPMEIIIVDNASTDETPLLLDRLEGARIVRNSENRNFVLAVNQAAREARGEYLLLLNNDAQVMPGTLAAALSAFRSAADIGAVGGRLMLLDGTLQEAGSIIWRDGSCLGYGRGDNPFAPMYMFRRDVDYCSGAFVLTSRQIWEESGGFDEMFKPAYYEETDYCTRLWKRGLRVVYEPRAALLHYEFASSNSTTSATDLQRDHQKVFANRHQTLLSSHYSADINNILLARMKSGGKKRVLFLDDRVPHTWLGSGFPRSRAILHALLRQDCFVTFYPLSIFEEDWISVYSDMPPEVEFMVGYGPPLLEPFLRTRQKYYDIVFVSRPHNMKLLKPILEAHPEWFEHTQVVYDAEAVFVAREITLRQLRGSPLTEEEAEVLLREEMALAAAADSVISVAESERPHFEKHGIERVHIIGHSISPQPTSRSYQDRKGFLFVGAIHEEASPNGDSVIWFLEEVFPKIQAELGSDIPFTIAGVNTSDRVRQLAQPPVRITGHLPDLTGLYETARVFVAPTRYAAGIPHKVHEAAARGLPVVATRLLASQLAWEDGSVFLVGGDATSFARRCVELYTNEALWTRLRNAALERITAECSADTFERQVKQIVTAQSERLADVGMDR